MLHSRVLWKVHSKDHPVTVTHTYSDTLTGCSYTTLPDSTLLDLLERARSLGLEVVEVRRAGLDS